MHLHTNTGSTGRKRNTNKYTRTYTHTHTHTHAYTYTQTQAAQEQREKQAEADAESDLRGVRETAMNGTNGIKKPFSWDDVSDMVSSEGDHSNFKSGFLQTRSLWSNNAVKESDESGGAKDETIDNQTESYSDGLNETERENLVDIRDIENPASHETDPVTGEKVPIRYVDPRDPYTYYMPYRGDDEKEREERRRVRDKQHYSDDYDTDESDSDDDDDDDDDLEDVHDGKGEVGYIDDVKIATRKGRI